MVSTHTDATHVGYDDRYADRVAPRISLLNFEARIDTITAEITAAAQRFGFFVLTDHLIPPAAIDAQFAAVKRFFELPDEVKAKTPFGTSCNAGWEKNGQVRPKMGGGSTDWADGAARKESYQMQFSEAYMARRWVSEKDLPGFRNQILAFMHACHNLSTRLMVCLARGLGYTKANGRDDRIFIKAHDTTRPNIQSVLRALRYLALDPNEATPAGHYRATAHADWSFLTLLFQRPGQGGLEMCPGRNAVTDFGIGNEWTEIEPVPGEIVCYVGDLLMFWSDDRYKSALHRLKTPADQTVDFYGDRYSLAFYNQPNSDCVIQGLQRKYPRITGDEFTRLAMERNFAELEAKQKAAFAETTAATAAFPTDEAAAAAAAFAHAMSNMETSFM